MKDGILPLRANSPWPGFIHIVDLKREQAAFFIQKKLGIVGGGLEHGFHLLEELLRLVKFRGGQASPHTIEKFGYFLVGNHGALINKVTYKRRVKARLYRIEIMLVADPERHLPVKGDGRVFRRGAFILGVAAFSCGPAGGSGAYGQGRAPFAFEQHLKAEAGIIQNGLELRAKGVLSTRQGISVTFQIS